MFWEKIINLKILLILIGEHNKHNMLFLFINKIKIVIIIVVISNIKNRRILIYSLSCDSKLISLLLIIISSMAFATVFVWLD